MPAMAFDKEQLLKALWSGVSQVPAGTFACCGEVDGTAHCLPASLSVEGLGKLPLPLSYELGFTLREMAETQPATYSCRKTSVPDPGNHDRRAWELGAARLSCPDNEEFLSQAVPKIASEFVGKLGEDAAAIQLKTKLLHFQLSERGGCIQFNRKFLEPGMFGLLILHLPTASGHKGGALVVSQDGTTQSLDCSEKSSSSWFEDFPMLWHKRKRPGLQPWVEALKDDSTAIEAPQVLAVPLGHKYKRKDLSFASLEGNDRVVVELLRQCGGIWSSSTDLSLQVQLCRLMKVQVSSSNGHRYERLECRNWVETDGSPVRFFRIQIDMKSEFVVSEGQGEVTTRDEHQEDEVHEDQKHDEDGRDKDSDDGSEDGSNPDNLENRQVSSESEELSATDHLALVVVFPKFQETYIACRAGFSGALDMVEGKHKEGAPEAGKDLRQLLDFYLNQPQHLKKVWKTRDARDGKNRSARLVKLCLLTGEYDHVSRLISMLGQDFEGKPAHAKTWYLGMGGVEVAKALALVVESHGQEASVAIQETLLRRPRVCEEAEYYAAYVIELHSRGCHEAAIAGGKKAYGLDLSTLMGYHMITVPALAAIAQMLILCVQEHIPSFLSSVQGSPTRTVFSLVLKLKNAVIAKSVSLEGNTLFVDVCRELAKRDLPSLGKEVQTDNHHPSVGRVMEVLLWLQNESVLQAGVQTLIRRARLKNQAALKELLASEVFWQQAAVTSMGRKALLSLAQERIGYLTHEPQPVFSYTPKPAPAPPAHRGRRFHSRLSASEAQARAATFARVGYERRIDLWAEGQKELENLRKGIQDIPRDREERGTLAGPKRLKAAHA